MTYRLDEQDYAPPVAKPVQEKKGPVKEDREADFDSGGVAPDCNLGHNLCLLPEDGAPNLCPGQRRW